MPDCVLTLTDTPDEMAQTVISEGLDRFNEAHTGVAPHSEPLAVLVANGSDSEVVGGLLGHTSLGLLFVDLFFLPDELRSTGLGSRILRQAEEEATRRGCRQAVLYTIAFQAPGFYERHGYEAFGEVHSGKAEQARIFMTKRLM